MLKPPYVKSLRLSRESTARLRAVLRDRTIATFFKNYVYAELLRRKHAHK